MRRSRVGAYGLWQLRDYLMDRGLPTLFVLLMLGYITIAPMLNMLNHRMDDMAARPAAVARLGGVDAMRAKLLHDASRGVLGNFLGVVVYLGAMLAFYNFVAADRKQGFYRFLFAKPVHPLRYYGQAFVIHWVSYVIIVAGMLAAYGFFVVPVLRPQILGVCAAMFLLYGGILFLLSASTVRADWLLLILVTVLSTVLWDKFGDSTSIFANFLYVFPPLHRTGEIYTAAAAATPVSRTLLGWFAGYGLACVIGALAVIRYRRMALA